MANFKTGCLVCGKPLQVFDTNQRLSCQICNQEFETGVACEDGHYICDSCRTQEGFAAITQYALQTDSKNPGFIAADMMSNAFIRMHGPEHHYLAVAALLCAYKNAGGDIELEACLDKALQRAQNIPGGICGIWGSCGAGIGAGMFVSIITGATPLSQKEWSLANAMTSRALENISKNGGPRCCKRNTNLSIKSAVLFVSEQFGIEMESTNSIQCKFFPMNKDCRKTACPFWPAKQP